MGISIDHCSIALRNLEGKLIGTIDVPDFDLDRAIDRDLPMEAFVAAYPNHLVRPYKEAEDGSCGLYTAGPLVGVWEWLDFGEEPVDSWASDAAMHLYRELI